MSADLREFLLARITEDEGDAQSLGAELRGASWQGGVGTPDRVLAECQAKRRIIELHGDDEDLHDCPPWGRRTDGSEPCLTLSALALPYADHPDYPATCGRCGKPAEGLASIGEQRFCHGDQDDPTCYMRQCWENSGCICPGHFVGSVGSPSLRHRSDCPLHGDPS